MTTYIKASLWGIGLLAHLCLILATAAILVDAIFSAVAKHGPSSSELSSLSVALEKDASLREIASKAADMYQKFSSHRHKTEARPWEYYHGEKSRSQLETLLEQFNKKMLVHCPSCQPATRYEVENMASIERQRDYARRRNDEVNRLGLTALFLALFTFLVSSAFFRTARNKPFFYFIVLATSVPILLWAFGASLLLLPMRNTSDLLTDPIFIGIALTPFWLWPPLWVHVRKNNLSVARIFAESVGIKLRPSPEPS